MTSEQLHTIYQRLIKAGMPAHERLSWQHQCWWRIEDAAIPDHWYTAHDEHAQAILTMHAMEWLNDNGCFERLTMCSDQGFYWNETKPNSPTILEAIAAAVKERDNEPS